MRRIALVVLVVVFICPLGAFGYWIDFSVNDNRHWHELRLYYIFGGYFEETAANSDGDAWWTFAVLPDEDDPLDAVATISLTHYTNTHIDISSSGFESFDFQISEPWYQDPTAQTISVPVGTRLSGGYPWDHVYPYFSEYPDPIDGIWEACGRVEVGVSWNTDFQILNLTPAPEPATIILLGTGLLGLAGFGKKKMRKK